MAQYRLNAYDADVFIPEFKGLMQYGDHIDGDLRYSPDCMNIATPGGVLQPSAVFVDSGEAVFRNTPSTPYPIYPTAPIYCTLMRYYSSGWNYVLGVDSKLYKGTLNPNTHEFSWTELQGISSSNGWSWCVYEYTPEGSTTPKTVLLITNTSNGMYVVDGNTVTQVTTPKKFARIEIYGERVWGCGAEDEPDTIYYSAPYSFSDWEQDNDDPANGGGSFREPTWNDDPINCLVRFGDALIAFTKYRAWKITGTTIESLYVQEQYGNGTDSPGSVAVYNNRIYLTRSGDGVCVYDGYSITPISNQYAYEYKEFNSARAVIADNVYIVSDTKYPTKLFVYNLLDNTFTVCNSPMIASFCEGCTYAMRWYMVRHELDSYYDIYVKPVVFYLNSWEANKNSGAATKWTTPWIEFGRKDIKKGGFDMYFSPELSGNATVGVPFKISFQTEKKTKTKTYTVSPLTAEEIAAGKLYKQKKLHFGGSGRKFRMIIETESGVTTPWRLIGGIHIIAETDKD